MGGAVSTGDDNDELVDNLVEADYIKTQKTERIFRAVDRADYFLDDHRESAYKDLAWKHGHLHLSAPCIYSEVLESLELEEGQSFLNLGSGTGYLSTMAGLVLGSYGVNHGVEVHEDVVDYARDKLEEFKAGTKAFEEFDFCEPRFVVGNCLQLNSACRLYDRVYCGAACPNEHEMYMKNLVKVGGILVMPHQDQLMQVRRTSETVFDGKSVLPVSFATLVSPNKDKPDVVDLPDCQVLSLQDICRHTVRGLVRASILTDHPLITTTVRRQRSHPPSIGGYRYRAGNRVNIVPMQMGMMILDSLDGHDISDEDDEDDFESFDENVVDRISIGRSRRLRNVRRGGGGGGGGENDSDDDDDENVEENDRSDGGGGEDKRRLRVNRNHNHNHRAEPGSSRRNPFQDFIKEEPEIEEAAAEATIDRDSGAVVAEVGPQSVASSSLVDNKRSSPSSLGQDMEGDNSSKRMRWLQDAEDDEEEEEDNEEEKAVEKKDNAYEGGFLKEEGRGNNRADDILQEEEEEEEEADDNLHLERNKQQHQQGAVSSKMDSSPIKIQQQHRHRSRRARRELSSEDSDLENMDLDGGAGSSGGGVGGGGAFQAPATPTSVLNALHLLSIPRKLRCSSSTSADTSETSGFGSFGEEPLEVPLLTEERGDSAPSSSGEDEGGSEVNTSSFTHKIVIGRKKKRSGGGKLGVSRCCTAGGEGGEGGESGSSSSAAEQRRRSEGGPTLAQLMKERIDRLPLPQALRSYLAYYRL